MHVFREGEGLLNFILERWLFEDGFNGELVLP